MKYLSIDIEATGLKENCQIIEISFVPFDASLKTIEENHIFHSYVKCPTYEELKSSLDPWVVTNMKSVLIKAHEEGVSLEQLRLKIDDYLSSEWVKNYFNQEKIVIFGKSLSALDLPFLKRDLGWDYFSSKFHHRTVDLSCFTYALGDSGLIPPELVSGEKLMKFFNLGLVAHTALEDARNTILLYFHLMDLLNSKVKN